MGLEVSIRLQPLVSLTNGDIYGYEMLSQPLASDVTLLANSNLLFSKSHLLLENVLKIRRFDSGQKISLNLTKEELIDENLMTNIKHVVQQNNFAAEDIIIEVSEESSMQQVEYVARILVWQDLGFKLALDDYGSVGMIPKKILNNVQFEIIKFDRSLLSVENDPQLVLEIIKNYVDYTKDKCGFTVLEGIETQQDLDLAKQAGVNLSQGYFTGRPKEVWRGEL